MDHLISLLSSEDMYASGQFVLDVDGLPVHWRTSFYTTHCYPCLTVRLVRLDGRGNLKKTEVTVHTVYSLRQRAFKKSVHIMSYTGKDETPELTYVLIRRAVCGDETALEMILRHFDAYITAVSTAEKALPSGEIIEKVDEDIKIQIQTHLVEVIQKRWRELYDPAARPVLFRVCAELVHTVGRGGGAGAPSAVAVSEPSLFHKKSR